MMMMMMMTDTLVFSFAVYCPQYQDWLIDWSSTALSAQYATGRAPMISVVKKWN